MIELFIPYPLLLIVSGLLTGTAAVFAARSRPRQGAANLSLLMVVATFWSLTYAAELNSTSLSQALFWARIQYIAIVLLPPSWLLFSLSITSWKKMQNRRFQLSLLIIPFIVLLFVWSNDRHNLFWVQNTLQTVNGWIVMKNTYGPVFWIHFIYSYILIFTGAVVLFYQFVTNNHIRRYRLIFLMIPIVPLAFNIIPFITPHRFDHLDLTPFAFTVSGLMLLWSSSSRLRLEIMPIARELVIENMDDGMIVIDHKGEIISANNNAFQITGFDSNTVLQSFIADTIIKHDLSRIQKNTQIELNGILHRPYVLFRASPLTDKGKPVGCLIALTDITQQKTAAIELLESRKRYELIFNEIRDAILVEDQNGRILDANPVACEMYGYSYSEILEKTVYDLLPGKQEHITLASFGEDRKQGTETLKTLNIRSNGEVFPVEVNGCSIMLSGETVLLVVIRDITEKVEAENALRSRERYLQLLNKITWDSLTGNDPEKMLQTLANRLGELFESSSTSITLWNQEKNVILPGAAYGPARDTYKSLGPQSIEHSITVDVLRSGVPAVIEDVYSLDHISPEVSLMYPVRSVMVLPLIAGERKLGAALIAYDTIHGFTEEDIHRGAQTADQISLSLSRAYLAQKTEELLAETRSVNETLEQRIQERTKQLVKINSELQGQITERRKAEAAIRTRLEIEHLISGLSSGFMDTDNFDTALLNSLETIGYITGASRTYVFFIREGREVLDNTHEWCASGVEPQIENLQDLPIDALPWWMAQLHDNRIIEIDDVSNMPPEAGVEQEILLDQGIKSLLVYPIFYGVDLAGFLGIDNVKETGLRPKEDVDLLSVLARTISSAFHIKQSQKELRKANDELRATYDKTIEGWARALELREKETAGHSERTVSMSIKFAERLKIDPAQIEHIKRGAILHDIGKMVIPDQILQKPGALTKEERAVINRHPEYSMKMLGHIDYLAPAVSIPFYHHERWDGTGYPKGLKGRDIPLPARLFALVDVWDALSSDRPYRKAMEKKQVIELIEEGIGTHFDQEIAGVFIGMLREEQ